MAGDDPCRMCGGSGVQGTAETPCDRCEGTGQEAPCEDPCITPEEEAATYKHGVWCGLMLAIRLLEVGWTVKSIKALMHEYEGDE